MTLAAVSSRAPDPPEIGLFRGFRQYSMNPSGDHLG